MARVSFDPIVSFEPTAIGDQPNDAAVIVPIVERRDEHAILVTKRADHLGEHPGQMSFPGGGAEPDDQSLLETATREAEEEIGLTPAETSVVGRLDDIRTVTEYAVTPFVARVPDRRYVPNDDEVAEIAIVPLAQFLDPGNVEFETRYHPAYGEIVVHYFHVDGYTVWGATARMLVQLLELATPFRAPELDDSATVASGTQTDVDSPE
ncbi:NUDIX hydrolase [Halovivax gelatinilyticus]|uniref:NUDIX hydrolase n=1 Tax=Halovivax gelatinilyticus TaxID=2961597 RepID=UPI0020CA3CB5|nr:CoA pyrophosphatase [Halovivax gelatinilyticus]